MSDNKDKVKGCVHPEDSWFNYGCGDCGDYADNNGCRGPRGKMDISSESFTVSCINPENIWNSIAEGPISNIPNDFKDIYLKVYDSAGNLILSDEYTLESKGPKKTGWTRISENAPAI